MERYTFEDFNRDFPTDDACLEWLRQYLYPDGIFCKKCERVTKHHRVASRPSYSCDHCGHHVHPTADTIFHKSPTPLRVWFHAVYIMAQTRCGISAKQLERETGVTYKTAWRMFNKIRSMLGEDVAPLAGPVEADETYVGGKRRGTKRGRPGKDSHKTPVVGVVERHGKVIARVTGDTTRATIEPIIAAKMLPKALVYTDEYTPYDHIGKKGYIHKRVSHSEKIYVVGDIHTNTIEGFWSLLKNGIRGVYHSVSHKHLPSYVNEYGFRYNHRSDETPMFQRFLGQIQKVAPAD